MLAGALSCYVPRSPRPRLSVSPRRDSCLLTDVPPSSAAMRVGHMRQSR